MEKISSPLTIYGGKMKHWWIKTKKFKRVRLTTLRRLALLYSAEVFGKKPPYVPDFILWLEHYMDEV